MSGQPYPTPSELQSLPEESLGLVSLATELAAVQDSLVELARLLPTVPRALWPGIIAAAAQECRGVGDSGHDVARYLESLAGPGEAPATRRDIKISRKGKPMNKLDSLSVPIAGALAYVTTSEPFGPVWSKVAAGVLAVIAWIIARKTPTKPKAQP